MTRSNLLTTGLTLVAFAGLITQPFGAQETEADETQEITVPITVEAEEPEVKPGKTTYRAEEIEEMPNGPAHLSDLLRANPAVDFSRDAGLSVGTASLRPAEVSIHGQLFYQNLFTIDGADTNNDMNPADAQDVWGTPSLVQPLGGSSPQGYYVDVELLEAVEVLDSNIPAEYGGFTGGVVDAKMKSYEGEDRFSVTYSMQRDEWEEFHVTEDDITSNDKWRGVYTPDYEKSTIKINASQAITDDIGITLGISKRQSEFLQEYEDDTDTINQIYYSDEIDSVMSKISGSVGGFDADLSLRYTNRAHDGLTSTTYTGSFVKEHKGFGWTAYGERDFDNGTLELSLSSDRLEDSLDSDSSFFTFHEYLENSGESRFSGAFGDVNQRQSRTSFKPKFTMNPRERGSGTHVVSFGADMRSTTSFYERPEDVVYEQYTCVRDVPRPGDGCIDQDGDGRSSAGDELLFRRAFYFAGKVELDYSEIAMYIQDAIEFERWDLTLGLRGDRNSYLDTFTVSPRVSAEWHLDREAGRTLHLGVNRYYGRSFLRYQLNDEIYGWRETYTNLTRIRNRPNEQVPCSVPDWENCTYQTFDSRNAASDLDSPYSDEAMIGWSQPLGGVAMYVQFVNREARDGVTRSRDEDGRYYYANDGRSSTRSITAQFTETEPHAWGSVLFRFNTGFSYRDRTSNRQDDTGYDEQLEVDLIYYQDQLIPASELPAWDYNIPVNLRGGASAEFTRIGLTWSHFLNYKRGGTIARDGGENWQDPATGVEYDIYEDFEFDDLVTLDWKFDWTQPITDRTSLFMRLQVHNVFDQLSDASLVDTRRRYNKGRRFWLEVGASFF